MNTLLIGSGLSLLACIIITPMLIPLLTRLKFGQSIREEGPAWHQKKSGTPTMGGLAIICAVVFGSLAAYFISGNFGVTEISLVVGSLLFGIIGFADDYIKVVKKRNLGLTSKQKFLAQLIAAVVVTVFMSHTGVIGGEIVVPFVKASIDIGLWTIPLAVFVQLAVVNSVNLTDGLDGLASSVTLIVSLFFMICAIKVGNTSIAVFMGAVAAACLGFLFFNANPAKVFMGDTGSLFLGGAIAVGAIGLKMPLILIIAGGIYLIETLSVMIQVVSFKTTGKRVFKMSPIHHHFELCGLNEKKIVLLFSFVTVVLCAISYIVVF